ncbi:IS30 family transposase [Fibrobacter sp. UWS1]|nr:IS30 family transposase [Fibrobacter sp. UWS1]PBC66547.1 IS30 family transposase [Fibrobacter sp. UWS1]PBC66608.1 IS30 family transposase [Fibrobacter sp. UWS1]PBC66630.1 IS30 family transposase [Fibrobacter sp. UWS1]PBC67228.1 IS30 family transposase [Fibrobacter sp. UWS1]
MNREEKKFPRASPWGTWPKLFYLADSTKKGHGGESQPSTKIRNTSAQCGKDPPKNIALQLKVHKSTIYRELNRGGGRQHYDPVKSQERADLLAATSHLHYDYDEDDWKIVDGKIKEDYSPEQVNGRAKLDGMGVPSVATIYRHVNKDEDLKKHLRHGKKPYRKRGEKKDKRGQIVGRVPIEERPAIVDEKSRVGDIEIDLINSADHDANLLTINDRMTNYSLIRYLPTKNAKDLKRTLVRALKDFEKTFEVKILTITSDNGKEFACHAEIAKAMKADYYFANPYHSWERGANENMNGLIRQYLPKKESFKGISPRKVRWIQDKLNNRPRKRLDFMTPLEYIYTQVKLQT